MREHVRRAAVADVHSPRYFNEFKEALASCQKPDLFLFAGDMVDFGKVEEYSAIADVIAKQFENDIPIVGCFGNDEKGASLQHVNTIVDGRIKFLDSETTVLTHRGRKIGILGIPVLNMNQDTKDRSLEEIFDKKIAYLSEQLISLYDSCDKTILLLHYSPLSTETFPETFSWWISKTFNKDQPDVIVHGHVHYAKKPIIRIGKTQLLNVAYPATRKVTEFQI